MASRANGKRSRGPKSAAGRQRSSRNALQHGLASTINRPTDWGAKIELLASAICAGETDAELYAQAKIIAECELLLNSIAAQKTFVVERLHDPTLDPLSKGYNGIRRTKELMRRYFKPIENELDAVRLGIKMSGGDASYPLALEAGGQNVAGFKWVIDEDRDEATVIELAMPDLEKLERYERRVWKQKKQALNNLEVLRVLQRL